MARTSALLRSAMEHISSPESRAAAARMSGSFCTGMAISAFSRVLLTTVCASCGLRSGLGLRIDRLRRVLCEDLVQRLDGGFHVAALKNVGRQKAKHSVTCAVDEDMALEHLCDNQL